MMYPQHGMVTGLPLLTLALLSLMLVLIGLVVAWLGRLPGLPGDSRRSAAEQTLADRLARGEIDSEEYEQRLRTLRAGRPG